MTDNEAERNTDSKPPSHIKKRRKQETKLDRKSRERHRELK
ncbi:MAG: hypothetical protein ABEK59_12145 [Halobacteria archaeon]